MARRRMIDPNIWNSEDVSKLDYFERLMLIGLFSNADDFGKGRANPSYLRSTIFPYDDIELDVIETALRNITEHIHVQFYSVEGNQYYIFANWFKWQTVQKKQKSNIPDPVENHSLLSTESFSTDSRPKEEKRREEEKKRKEEEEKRREESSAAAIPLDENLSLVIESFNHNIHLATPIECEKLKSWLDDMEPAVVKAAIEEAVVYGKRSYGYIQKILQAWLSQNITTELALNAHKRDRKDGEHGGRGKSEQTAGEYVKQNKDKFIGKPTRDYSPEEYSDM